MTLGGIIGLWVVLTIILRYFQKKRKSKQQQMLTTEQANQPQGAPQEQADTAAADEDSTTSWVAEYLKDGRFSDVSARYLAEADTRKTAEDRLNWLGLAALYDLKYDDAIRYFREALGGAVGNMQNTLEDNLACAYLQKGWYSDALDLLEHTRSAGYVVIVSYVLALIMNHKFSDAKKFFEMSPCFSGVQDTMDTLLRFNPRHEETLAAAREALHNPYLRIYYPALKRLFEIWDLHVFFEKENRYEMLAQQCQDLLTLLTEDGTWFQSPLIRYMRNILLLIADKVSDYHRCIELYGLINGFEQLSEDMPLTPAVRAECAAFWRRTYYVLNKTFNPNEADWNQTEAWLVEQLPADVVRYETASERCDLYFSQSLQRGVRILRQFGPSARLYAEFISEEEAMQTCHRIEPVVRILTADSTVDHILEPLVFNFVYDVNQVQQDAIHDALLRLPNNYREQLHDLAEPSVEAETSETAEKVLD